MKMTVLLKWLPGDKLFVRCWLCVFAQVKIFCWVLREVGRPLRSVQHARRQVSTINILFKIFSLLQSFSYFSFFCFSESKLKCFASLQCLGKDLQQMSDLQRYVTGKRECPNTCCTAQSCNNKLVNLFVDRFWESINYFKQKCQIFSGSNFSKMQICCLFLIIW